MTNPTRKSKQQFRDLLQSVQVSGEDFEWYPTTDRMIAVVARYLDKTATAIMDVGAGDGRVLAKLATHFETPAPQLYAIEKSITLVQAQPDNVIPVGTDLFEQNLTSLPVDYIFCNPPYSEYETWASVIIESGHARRAFLILPRRWTDNKVIALSLKKRGATTRILHSDDFYDAPRQARAVVDVIEIVFPMKSDSYSYRGEVRDPFDIWFDENISTFDQEEDDHKSSYELDQQAMARIRHLNTIGEMVEAYREEYARMEENYRAIFRLDYALLKELGVGKETVREGIKVKMAGLKSKYWTVLFERLDVITNRLSTATKAKFMERLVGRVALAFTPDNAYAVVLWAIKSANKYFDEQTVRLYRDLSTFDGVMKYKSNVRTWERNDWRYYRGDGSEDDTQPTRYALDYRIVLERTSGIYASDFGRYDYPGNLYKGCHETIADVVAVLYNLGFPSQSSRSLDREWDSGVWQNWYRLDKGESRSESETLFQVKAHKNGNLHFRFLPAAIKALNVEAGRLLGWLHSPAEVVNELGYTEEEAIRYYSSMKTIMPTSARLMLGSGEGEPT